MNLNKEELKIIEVELRIRKEFIEEIKGYSQDEYEGMYEDEYNQLMPVYNKVTKELEE